MKHDFTSVQNIYIICGKTDMRKGIDGLATIIQDSFELDPYSDSIKTVGPAILRRMALVGLSHVIFSTNHIGTNRIFCRIIIHSLSQNKALAEQICQLTKALLLLRFDYSSMAVQKKCCHIRQ